MRSIFTKKEIVDLAESYGYIIEKECSCLYVVQYFNKEPDFTKQIYLELGEQNNKYHIKESSIETILDDFHTLEEVIEINTKITKFIQFVKELKNIKE